MSERIAVCPGSFDPITMGHLDIITRASAMFDKLIVVVMNNVSKHYTFSPTERKEMIEKCVKDLPNVQVDVYDGLLAEYAAQQNACAIIKGLRAMSDFEYEFQMALINRRMAPEIETLFMMPSENLAYVTASTVREIASYGGDTAPFVTDVVQANLEKRKSQGKA